MAEADRRRWDSRHAVASGHRPMPPDALRGREHLLPGCGRALDVACGRGATAVWLAQQGLDVDAVDISPTGLAAGAVLADHCGVRVRWCHHDLDSGLPSACAGPYDVVVCQRFRDPTLYPALTACLADGGLLVLTVLSEVDEGAGPFRATPGELPAAFDRCTVLVHTEGNGQAHLVARNPRVTTTSS